MPTKILPKPAKIFRTRRQEMNRLLDELYSHLFEGTNRAQSNKINTAILESVLDRSSNEHLKQRIMKTVPNVNEGQAEVIARTEKHVLKTSLRMAAYKQEDPRGQHKYKWIGPTDSRTTPVCKNIVRRTQKGVTMEELEEIIREEANRFDPNFEVRGYTPHYNCRHQPIRVFY